MPLGAKSMAYACSPQPSIMSLITHDILQKQTNKPSISFFKKNISQRAGEVTGRRCLLSLPPLLLPPGWEGEDSFSLTLHSTTQGTSPHSFALCWEELEEDDITPISYLLRRLTLWEDRRRTLEGWTVHASLTTITPPGRKAEYTALSASHCTAPHLLSGGTPPASLLTLHYRLPAGAGGSAHSFLHMHSQPQTRTHLPLTAALPAHLPGGDTPHLHTCQEGREGTSWEGDLVRLEELNKPPPPHLLLS